MQHFIFTLLPIAKGLALNFKEKMGNGYQLMTITQQVKYLKEI
jgi:hypothetical protein